MRREVRGPLAGHLIFKTPARWCDDECGKRSPHFLSNRYWPTRIPIDLHMHEILSSARSQLSTENKATSYRTLGLPMWPTRSPAWNVSDVFDLHHQRCVDGPDLSTMNSEPFGRGAAFHGDLSSTLINCARHRG
jgi:hypothetical protein